MAEFQPGCRGLGNRLCGVLQAGRPRALVWSEESFRSRGLVGGASRRAAQVAAGLNASSLLFARQALGAIPTLNRDTVMTLMHFDPFRDLERLTEQALGYGRGPRDLPMEALRRGDGFLIALDVPGGSRQ